MEDNSNKEGAGLQNNEANTSTETVTASTTEKSEEEIAAEAAAKEAEEKAAAEEEAARVAAEEEAAKVAAEEAAKAAEAEQNAGGDNTTFEDATVEHTHAAILNMRGVTVKVYNQFNHGANFFELAQNYAARKGAEFRAELFTPPVKGEIEEEPDTVYVLTANNQLVRKFSLVVHGEDYVKKAEDFVSKYAKRKGYKLK